MKEIKKAFVLLLFLGYNVILNQLLSVLFCYSHPHEKKRKNIRIRIACDPLIIF